MTTADCEPTKMIKIVAIQPLDYPKLELSFSDGTAGVWSAEDILARETVLTRSLLDQRYFARAFIEGGALAWPNGLELSPAALHSELASAGRLSRHAA